MYWKGKSGGLTGKGNEHFKGVAVLDDSELTGTSNGGALCLGFEPCVSNSLGCLSLILCMLLPHASKPKWHLMPNTSNKQTLC